MQVYYTMEMIWLCKQEIKWLCIVYINCHRARMISGRYRCGTFFLQTRVSVSCQSRSRDPWAHPAPSVSRLPWQKHRTSQVCQGQVISQQNLFGYLWGDLFKEYWRRNCPIFLDPSVCPIVIEANRKDKTFLPILLEITATWCHSLHNNEN